MVILRPTRKVREALPAREIGERWHVPVKYLEQILTALKEAGIVESQVGASGGYRDAMRG